MARQGNSGGAALSVNAYREYFLPPDEKLLSRMDEDAVLYIASRADLGLHFWGCPSLRLEMREKMSYSMGFGRAEMVLRSLSNAVNASMAGQLALLLEEYSLRKRTFPVSVVIDALRVMDPRRTPVHLKVCYQTIANLAAMHSFASDYQTVGLDVAEARAVLFLQEGALDGVSSEELHAGTYSEDGNSGKKLQELRDRGQNMLRACVQRSTGRNAASRMTRFIERHETRSKLVDICADLLYCQSGLAKWIADSKMTRVYKAANSRTDLTYSVENLPLGNDEQNVLEDGQQPFSRMRRRTPAFRNSTTFMRQESPRVGRDRFESIRDECLRRVERGHATEGDEHVVSSARNGGRLARSDAVGVRDAPPLIRTPRGRTSAKQDRSYRPQDASDDDTDDTDNPADVSKRRDLREIFNLMNDEDFSDGDEPRQGVSTRSLTKERRSNRGRAASSVRHLRPERDAVAASPFSNNSRLDSCSDTSNLNIATGHNRSQAKDNDVESLDADESDSRRANPIRSRSNTLGKRSRLEVPMSPVPERVQKPRVMSKRFTQLEDNQLLQGLEKYGWGEWQAILHAYNWDGNRTNVSLKDRARTLSLNPKEYPAPRIPDPYVLNRSGRRSVRNSATRGRNPVETDNDSETIENDDEDVEQPAGGASSSRSRRRRSAVDNARAENSAAADRSANESSVNSGKKSGGNRDAERRA